MKKCYACKESLPLDAFGLDKSKVDGRANICRPCRALKNQQIKLRQKIVPDTKKCSKCKEIKGSDDFYPRSNSASGLDSSCKDCRRISDSESYRRRPYVPADPHKKWAINIYNKYGITPEHYESMLNAQNGCCAGCLKPSREMSMRMAVDHDHSCCPGKKITCGGRCIRGLLCNKCNRLLGLADDNPVTLLNLIKYLEDKKFNDIL